MWYCISIKPIYVLGSLEMQRNLNVWWKQCEETFLLIFGCEYFFPCLLSWRWTKMHVWFSAVLCHACVSLFHGTLSYAALAKWFCVITCWNTMAYMCVLDPSICVWGSFICMFTIFLINAIRFVNLVPLYFLFLCLYVLLTAKIIWTCEYEFKICNN